MLLQQGGAEAVVRTPLPQATLLIEQRDESGRVLDQAQRAWLGLGLGIGIGIGIGLGLGLGIGLGLGLALGSTTTNPTPLALALALALALTRHPKRRKPASRSC